MSLYHRPSLTETVPTLLQTYDLDYNHFCEIVAEHMPYVCDCPAWQWKNPPWVNDLAYDTAFRVPEDGDTYNTFVITDELRCIVKSAFPCFDDYRTTWFLEELYRYMGRMCTCVPPQRPRDLTNYQMMAPTFTLDEEMAITASVTLGQPNGAIRMIARETFATQEKQSHRFVLFSLDMDEQGMAEYEECANKCLDAIISQLGLHVKQLRYTPTWNDRGKSMFNVAVTLQPKTSA